MFCLDRKIQEEIGCVPDVRISRPDCSSNRASSLQFVNPAPTIPLGAQSPGAALLLVTRPHLCVACYILRSAVAGTIHEHSAKG
jgi:hypothetical protein